MPDLFKRVSQGQPLQIGATTWNALMAGGRRAARGLNAPAPGGGAGGEWGWLSNHRVLVKNETGTNLSQRNVVTPQNTDWTNIPPVSPVDQPNDVQHSPSFDVIKPTSETDQPFIIVDGCPNSSMCYAIVQGIAVVELDVVDESHTHARCEADNYTRLVTDTCGPARVLWHESGTGFKRGLVLLGPACPKPVIGFAEVSPTYYEITDFADQGDSVTFEATGCLSTKLTLQKNRSYAVHMGVGLEVSITHELVKRETDASTPPAGHVEPYSAYVTIRTVPIWANATDWTGTTPSGSFYRVYPPGGTPAALSQGEYRRAYHTVSVDGTNQIVADYTTGPDYVSGHMSNSGVINVGNANIVVGWLVVMRVKYSASSAYDDDPSAAVGVISGLGPSGADAPTKGTFGFGTYIMASECNPSGAPASVGDTDDA